MRGAFKMARLDHRSCGIKMIAGMYAVLMAGLGLCVLLDDIDFSAFYIPSWGVSMAFGFNSFLIQEKERLERLYASLPLKDSEVVAGRYVYLFEHYFWVCIFAYCVTGVCMAASGAQAIMQHLLIGAGGALVVFSGIVGVQMPIFFKHGHSQGRVAAALGFGVVGVPTSVLGEWFYDQLTISGHVGMGTWLFLGVCLLLCILIVVISYRVSLTAYRQHL
ncbi:MAG: ABC-2 transporter permease [Peptococcaceae bacterium]|nr:ABC-2 transporter permease [Peptococcaceae bacterium]